MRLTALLDRDVCDLEDAFDGGVGRKAGGGPNAVGAGESTGTQGGSATGAADEGAIGHLDGDDGLDIGIAGTEAKLEKADGHRCLGRVLDDDGGGRASDEAGTADARGRSQRQGAAKKKGLGFNPPSRGAWLDRQRLGGGDDAGSKEGNGEKKRTHDKEMRHDQGATTRQRGAETRWIRSQGRPPASRRRATFSARICERLGMVLGWI